MTEKIIVPVLGESITEATVSKWLKNEGDKVNADEPIVELETDKVNLEVPSPVSGILTKINSKDGSVVEVGALLGSVSEKTGEIKKNVEIKKIEPKTDENNVIKLDAQKETTKSIRDLTAYFLKQDRAEARKRLEDQMEERSAVQVSGDGSKKGKGFSAKLPRKGLLGAFADFLMTGILGAKGAGIFRGLFSSLRFAPGALIKFGRLLGAALLVPDLANAFGEAFKEDSLSDGLKTFIKSFFKQK